MSLNLCPQSGSKYIENFGYFLIFRNLKFGQESRFGATFKDNRIFQFERGLLQAILWPLWDHFWTFVRSSDPKVVSLALKLRVKTLPFQPKLQRLQIVCSFETSWEFPFFSQILWLWLHLISKCFLQYCVRLDFGVCICLPYNKQTEKGLHHHTPEAKRSESFCLIKKSQIDLETSKNRSLSKKTSENFTLVKNVWSKNRSNSLKVPMKRSTLATIRLHKLNKELKAR